MPENPGNYELMSLESVNGGQAVALFNREVKKILTNVADENTEAKAVRSLTLVIKFRPEDDRGGAQVEVTHVTKLAPVKPSRSFAAFSYDGDDITAYQSDISQLKLGKAGTAEEPLEGEGKVLNMPGRRA
jgi:hypothetical protein